MATDFPWYRTPGVYRVTAPKRKIFSHAPSAADMKSMKQSRSPARSTGRLGVHVVLAAFTLLWVTSAWGQNGPELPRELPRGFRSIELGLPVEEVQRLLVEDMNFNYRGDPDVSLLPATGNQIIEVSGYTFIERAWFQFQEGSLFSITLRLNPSVLDHYGMYTTLVERYGEPDLLSPRIMLWQSDAVRMSLERPLTVKYIDRVVFEQLLEEGRIQESVREMSRRQFIEQF